MMKMKLPALLLAATLSSAVLAAEPADLMIVNGRMPTVKADGTTAIAVKGNRIMAVGSDQSIAAHKGPNTRVIDAGGHSVIPGFNDNHVHLAWGAASLEVPDVRFAKGGLTGVQQMVREQAAKVPGSGWVELGGWGPEQVPDGRPTRQMLDEVVADRPVVLWSLGRHDAWLNSKALETAKIDRNTPDPPQGVIERDPVTGEPTGWLKEFTAIDLVTRAMPQLSRERKKARMAAAMVEAHRYGVTAVVNAGGSPEELELLDEMRREGRLSLRVNYALLVRPGFTDADFARYQAVWKAHPDTPLLKTGTVKLFMDGVPQSDTAFLLSPYGPQKIEGHPVYPQAEIKRLARQFDAAGWQLMMHAMGDAAVRLALDSIEGAEKANPAPARGRRPRIEHVFLLDPADVPRFRQLNVTAAYQPVDLFLPPDTQVAPADPNRAPREGARWNAVRDAGGRAAFGSDWPVFTMNALARIYAIANSRRADQRRDVPALIDAYTRDSAYVMFGDDRGTLEAGKLADIVILSRDIIGTPPRTADDLAVDTTIFDGKVVYQRRVTSLAH